MANRYPLVLNGSTIEELQDGDSLVGVSAAGNATNADNLKVGTNYVATSIGADANTIAARTSTGLLYAATPAQTSNDTTLATTSYVKTAIANLVDSAPGALDTLNELAAALGDDANFSTTVANALGTKAPVNSPTFTGTVAGITKAMVGLSNVDNTADANKAVASATTATNLSGSVVGSVPYQSAANTTSLLSPGTAGYVLKTNGANQNPEWVNPNTLSASSATTATNLSGSVVGSIPYQSAANTTSFLSPGTINYVLKSSGANSAPVWADVAGLVAGISVSDTTGQTGINLDLTTGVITGACSGLTTTSNVEFASIKTTSLTTGLSSTAGTITGTWSLSANSTLQATYADLAEKYLADKDYEVGTVMIVGGEKEVTASYLGSRAIGVVSANPAFILNKDLENGTLVALKGRIPVKVDGVINKGDRLVAGNNGSAVKSLTANFDVFAIALETSSNAGIKLIECVLL